MIADLEKENAQLKVARDKLADENVQTTTKMDEAFRQFDDIKRVVVQTNEARSNLNRIMGPQGKMNENERKTLLNSNLMEHDLLLAD